MKRARRIVVGALLLALAAAAYERFVLPPSAEEIEGLREERDRLEQDLGRRLPHALVGVPQSSVVVGIPSKLGERLAREMAASFVPEVALKIDALELTHEGDLYGKLLLGRSKLGRFTVNVHIDRATATLRPGRPQFQFSGDRVQVQLPLSLVKGTGRGRLRFRWDGRGVAGAVCGDLDVSGPVGGKVVPAVYDLAGGFRLRTRGSTLIAHPEVSDLKLKLRIEPDAGTWRMVEEAMRRQNAICRGALAVGDVKDKVRAAIDKGFMVTVPPDLIPEVPFPAGMEGVLAEGEGPRFEVAPAGLAVTRGWLWYGAEVKVVKGG